MITLTIILYLYIGWQMGESATATGHSGRASAATVLLWPAVLLGSVGILLVRGDR